MNTYQIGKYYFVGGQKVRYQGEVGAQLMFTPVDAAGKATGLANQLLPETAAATVAVSSGGATSNKLLLEVVI